MPRSAVQEFPLYSTSERRADLLVHAVGVTAGVHGVAWMLAVLAGAEALPARTVWSLVVYGLGLLGMLVASASYHVASPGPRKAFLRRIDQVMIFAMIAGTYTPFTLVGLRGGVEGDALCAAVWSVAAMGAAVKFCCPGRFERLGLGLYLGLGWAILAVIGPLSASLSPQGLWLLAMGGVIYTAGVVFYLLEDLPYHNALWHLMVLIAATCHFAAIAMEFVP